MELVGQGKQEQGGWRPRPFDEYIIYECCVGSFTPEVRGGQVGGKGEEVGVEEVAAGEARLGRRAEWWQEDGMEGAAACHANA